MLKTCIVGASGYTGAELVKIIVKHPTFKLTKCYVSENSQYNNMSVSKVHPELNGLCSLTLESLSNNQISELKDHYDIIFLATPHEFSHDHLPSLLGGKAVVFDLSGAYRISDTKIFEHYYGFEHQHQKTLEHAVYGLAEWHSNEIKTADYVAVPGCYPTASLLALKPLIETGVLNLNHTPVINAVSGVSGAGRKASMTTSFYEVSLQAYGVLNHRHTPEIEEYAKTSVIFTPHLGPYKRGILSTVTAFVNSDVTKTDIHNAFNKAYSQTALVRLCENMPKIDHVANTPFCHIAFEYDETKKCVVVTSAIDNLLKGASSQAVQCANIRFDKPETAGLM